MISLRAAAGCALLRRTGPQSQEVEPEGRSRAPDQISPVNLLETPPAVALPIAPSVTVYLPEDGIVFIALAAPRRAALPTE